MSAHAVGSDLRRMARGRLSGLEECEGGTRVVLERDAVIISSEPQMHYLMCKDKLVGSTIYLSRNARDLEDWYLCAQDGPLAGTTYANEGGILRVITRSTGDVRRTSYKRS